MAKNALRTLIIDDSTDDTLFIVRRLKERGYDVYFERVDTKDEMAAALSQKEWDIILCDYELPHFNGLRALELYKETDLDIPFIIVSGVISEDVAVELMKKGVHDYIAKGNLVRLVPAVARELAEVSLRRERKSVEESFRENEDLYRIAIESSSDGFILVDIMDGAILYANKRFLDIFGCDDLSKIKGTSFASMIHPEDHHFINFYLAKVHAGGPGSSLCECRGLRSDGAHMILEISAVSMAGRNEEMYVMHVRDVTERKRVEAEHSRLFNLSNDMLCIGGFDGYFRQLNPAWTKCLGWSRGELMSRRWLEFTHPQDRLATINAGRRLGEGEILTSFENRYLAKDGSYRWISWNSYPLIEKGLVFSVARDVTEKKLASEEIAKTVKDLRKHATAIIDVIARTVEIRDPYTSGHQKRVAGLAAAIAGEMGLSRNEIDGIRLAGSIHDLGKISVPSEILSMPRKLTEVEFNLIKAHSQVGYDILKNIHFEWPIAEMVYEHHERINGSGYPRGLSGDDIRRESKILSVADVVEAIESHRPYRPALGREAALEEIEKNKGILYDADVVNACVSLYKEKGFVLDNVV